MAAIEYTHSGHRFVLGYADDHYGIWDRDDPAGPVQRFPRTDEGWAEAWRWFSAWEPQHVEVALAGPRPTTVMPPFRPTDVLAKWVVGLLVVVALLSALTIAMILIEVGLLDRAESGRNVTAAELESAANRETAATALQGLAAAAAGITWLVWQFRAHRNLLPLGARALRFTPGWAAGWWLIPIANLWKPYQTTKELWLASDPDAGPEDWTRRRRWALLPVWWAVYLLSLPRIDYLGDDPDIADVRRVGYMLITHYVLVILAAPAAIAVVRGIQRRQDAKRARAELEPGAAAATVQPLHPSASRYTVAAAARTFGIGGAITAIVLIGGALGVLAVVLSRLARRDFEIFGASERDHQHADLGFALGLVAIVVSLVVLVLIIAAGGGES